MHLFPVSSDYSSCPASVPGLHTLHFCSQNLNIVAVSVRHTIYCTFGMLKSAKLSDHSGRVFLICEIINFIMPIKRENRFWRRAAFFHEFICVDAQNGLISEIRRPLKLRSLRRFQIQPEQPRHAFFFAVNLALDSRCAFQLSTSNSLSESI